MEKLAFDLLYLGFWIVVIGTFIEISVVERGGVNKFIIYIVFALDTEQLGITVTTDDGVVIVYILNINVDLY